MGQTVTIKGFDHHILGWSVDTEGYAYLLVDTPTDDGMVPYRHYPQCNGAPFEWFLLDRDPGSLDHHGALVVVDGQLHGSDRCGFLEGEPCYIVESP